MTQFRFPFFPVVPRLQHNGYFFIEARFFAFCGMLVLEPTFRVSRRMFDYFRCSHARNYFTSRKKSIAIRISASSALV